MPIQPGEQGARCPKCSTVLDEGSHHLVCCHQNQVTQRHHVMVEALALVARAPGVPYKKEQRVDDNSRPGDLLLSRLSVNGPGAVYVTIRDPLAPSHPVGVEGVGTWHSRQEQEKNEKYVVRCHRRGWAFIPFVLDMFGGWVAPGQPDT